jgi:hypothetical protein
MEMKTLAFVQREFVAEHLEKITILSLVARKRINTQRWQHAILKNLLGTNPRALREQMPCREEESFHSGEETLWQAYPTYIFHPTSSIACKYRAVNIVLRMAFNAYHSNTRNAIDAMEKIIE